ncbi:MAG: RtcB family protein, partial [Flavobacterium sp.]
MNTQINGNDLLALGYAEGNLIGIALKCNRKRTGFSKAQMLDHFAKVLADPENYLNDALFGTLAQAIIEKAQEKPEDFIALNPNPNTYISYGENQIEDGAKAQMNIAMQLPVTVAGALMPDAHQGYGLPIGGVLATKNAIIPYGVG